MAEPLVAVRDLVVSYGSRSRFRSATRKAVLRGVTLDIAPGETIGIVGESGSGKTTLGRAMLGLVPSASGSIRFDGMEISDRPEAELRPLRRRMQMIFQDATASLNPRRHVGPALREPLMLHGVAAGPADADRRVEAMLDRVRLPADVLRRYPHELSGGQRQRVGIARAILLRPDFVVADEIVSGLDVSTQAQVLALIGELTAEMGLAMAFISHDLAVVKSVCSRVAVMRGGEIVEEGSAASVLGAPAHAYTRELLAAVPPHRPDPDWLSPQ